MNINEELLQRAIQKWGKGAQLEMVIEEMSELIHAIQKHKRSPGSMLTYKNLIDEVADATIMVRQLHKMLDNDAIQLRIDFKMSRLQSRLDKNEF